MYIHIQSSHPEEPAVHFVVVELLDCFVCGHLIAELAEPKTLVLTHVVLHKPVCAVHPQQPCQAYACMCNLQRK